GFSCSKRSNGGVRTANSRQQGKLSGDLFSHCFEYAIVCIPFDVKRSASLSPSTSFIPNLKLDGMDQEETYFLDEVRFCSYCAVWVCVKFFLLHIYLLFSRCYFLGLKPRFVLDIYEAEKKLEKKEVISQIPLLVP
ncbi:hypothetical protein QQP08_011733, partial [Theobroma cacao]